MTTLIEKNLPYKLYSAVNLGSKDGMFYLGKIPNNLNFNKKIYSDDYYANCFSGYYFSIASLVPGSCIRMDKADEVDSNILIDAKWVDFRPCNNNTCESSNWSKGSILKSVDYSNHMVTKPLFKSLTSDGTITISGLESNFIWNDIGVNNPNETSHSTLLLQACKYKFENASDEYPGPYFGTLGTPGESDVIFLMASLVGSTRGEDGKDQGIKIVDTGTELYVQKITLCDKIPCEEYDITRGYMSMKPDTQIMCDPYIPYDIGTFI